MHPALALVPGVVLLLLNWIWSATGSGSAMDEGQLLAYPDLVLRGALPNVDFEHTYGPMNLWVLAAAFRVFGFSIAVERSVGLLYRIAIAASAAAIYRSRGAGRGQAAGAAWLSLAFLTETDLVAFAWLGGVACVLGALWFLSRCETDAAAAAGGALGALAVSFRPDLLPAALISALPCVVLSRRKVAFWAAGALLGALPLAAHVQRAGMDALMEAWLLNPLRAAPGRRLPIPPRGILEFLGFIGVVASVVALGARALRSRADASAALLAVGLLHQMLQRADLSHATYVGCATIPLSLPLLAGERSRRQVLGALALTVVAVVVAARHAIGVVQRKPVVRVTVGDRSFPVTEPADARALSAILSRLDDRARDGERLFVGPLDLTRTKYGDTFVYALVPRLIPGSYHTEMNPGVANRVGGRLAADLGRTDWLLLTDRHDRHEEPNASRSPGAADAALVLRDSFHEVAREPPFVLFGRNRAHPDRRAESRE